MHRETSRRAGRAVAAGSGISSSAQRSDAQSREAIRTNRHYEMFMQGERSTFESLRAMSPSPGFGECGGKPAVGECRRVTGGALRCNNMVESVVVRRR